MNTTHSTTPWTADENGRGIFDADGQRIANAFCVVQLSDGPLVREIKLPEQQANKRMMAASPELLEACQACLKLIPGLEVRSWPPGHAMKKNAIELLTAAIAKATEESGQASIDAGAAIEAGAIR